MKVLTVVGARPQFVKAATVSRAFAARGAGVSEVIVHTGQHFDQNMSDVFFDEMQIPCFVTDTLAKWGLAPSDLELDVTESMLARAAFAQNDALERLHALGIKISIDDFGTKYSTLDYLRTYRVSRLKIPQMLIDSAMRNAESAAMVRAIMGIARELNIEVIAQGVENEAQWSFLTATAPVSNIQGFYYSEPVPAANADDLLRRGVISPASASASAGSGGFAPALASSAANRRRREATNAVLAGPMALLRTRAGHPHADGDRMDSGEAGGDSATLRRRAL